MEDIHTSQVYKCLERKNLILGFEIIDLLILGIILCALNLIFAQAQFKFLFTFLPVGIAGWLLRLSKSGRPDGYLIHVIQYYLNPGVLSAWPKAKSKNQLLAIQQEGVTNARFKFK